MTAIPRPRPRRWLPGRDRRAERHSGPTGAAKAQNRSAVVVGGGIAGLSAAAVLAERGVEVTLIEREQQLGGRVRSWPTQLDEATTASMGRGFHAFFRQYYQLRALLRRADPELRSLRPVEDYPLRHADGQRDSFAAIPRTPPLNLLGFVLGSPSFPLRRLPQVDVGHALGLLDVDFPATFSAYDGVSAAELLDRLNFPDECRHLALEVFARSFFAASEDFAAAEMVAMFHSYFLGSAEGLLFDVPTDDFDTALWAPLGVWLERHGVELRTSTTVEDITVGEAGVAVRTADSVVEADALVLATDLRNTQQLVTTLGSLDQPADDQLWEAAVAAQPVAPPFVVWRRWFDAGVHRGAPDFLGTSGYGPLDNVSMIHQMEAGAARWAKRTSGSVVELHAYALAPDFDEHRLRADLDQQLHRLHPELIGACTLGEQWLVRADCPLPGLGPWRERPGVTTPSPRLVLAGDGVRCPYPVALMERAATTGVLAANQLLSSWGVAGSDIWTTPTSPRLRWVRPLRRLVDRHRSESKT